MGILLYRKHVITEQPYIAQLIECMEQYGLRPLPIFINGVEAHTVVSCSAAGARLQGHLLGCLNLVALMKLQNLSACQLHARCKGPL